MGNRQSRRSVSRSNSKFAGLHGCFPLAQCSPELLLNILQWMTPADLLKCELVCRNWHQMIMRAHLTNKLQKMRLDCLCVLETVDEYNRPTNPLELRFHPHRRTIGNHESHITFTLDTVHRCISLLTRFQPRSLVFWRLSAAAIKAVLTEICNSPLQAVELHFYECDFDDAGGLMKHVFVQMKATLKTLIISDGECLSSCINSVSLAPLLTMDVQEVCITSNRTNDGLDISEAVLIALATHHSLSHLKLTQCLNLSNEVLLESVQHWVSASHKSDKCLEFFRCPLIDFYQVRLSGCNFVVQDKSLTLTLANPTRSWSCFCVM